MKWSIWIISNESIQQENLAGKDLQKYDRFRTLKQNVEERKKERNIRNLRKWSGLNWQFLKRVDVSARKYLRKNCQKARSNPNFQRKKIKRKMRERNIRNLKKWSALNKQFHKWADTAKPLRKTFKKPRSIRNSRSKSRKKKKRERNIGNLKKWSALIIFRTSWYIKKISPERLSKSTIDFEHKQKAEEKQNRNTLKSKKWSVLAISQNELTKQEITQDKLPESTIDRFRTFKRKLEENGKNRENTLILNMNDENNRIPIQKKARNQSIP